MVPGSAIPVNLVFPYRHFGVNELSIFKEKYLFFLQEDVPKNEAASRKNDWLSEEFLKEKRCDEMSAKEANI